MKSQIKRWFTCHVDILRATLVVLIMLIPLFLFGLDRFYRADQIYGRLDVPSDLKLENKEHYNNCNGQGMPCYIGWSYRYSISTNEKAEELADTLNQRLKETNFDPLSKTTQITSEAKATGDNQVEVTISQML